jgi:hypothetical protein
VLGPLVEQAHARLADEIRGFEQDDVHGPRLAGRPLDPPVAPRTRWYSGP